jgi:nitrite reductase (cytochrome c-552)
VRTARGHQRSAQFLLDFIEAENSMGFHAPQEAARILGHSLDRARRGQVALRGVAGATAATTPAAGVRPTVTLDPVHGRNAAMLDSVPKRGGPER